MGNWTDLATLRKHLQAFDFDAIRVRFLEIVLPGSEQVQLPHNGLASGTVTVYTINASEPTGPDPLTLTGTSWHATGYDAFKPASVVVAEDDMPLDRYAEGADYAIENESARIKRLAGGSITDGATVQVWLLPLTALTEDVDYEIDTDTGVINRLAGGSLPDPARVYVSYDTTPARASEDLLLQAITEAEGKILARLKDGYDSSSDDDGLVIGATELALAIVCDDLAGGVLAGYHDSGADDRARRYMELARRYEERALYSLTPFLRLPPPAVAKRQQNPVSGAGW